MTEQQIRRSIRSGWPFFGVTDKGVVLARYVPFGLVLRWDRHHMIPTPWQGEDLLWWLQAAEEEEIQE